MEAYDKLYNMKRSFNKYMEDQFATEYPINYSEIKKPMGHHNQWLEISWLSTPGGLFTKTMAQLSCCSIIKADPLKDVLNKMVDKVVEGLNTDTIPLFDFEDPVNPIDLEPYVLIPRYDNMRELRDEADDSVYVTALTYRIHWFRMGVLP